MNPTKANPTYKFVLISLLTAAVVLVSFPLLFGMNRGMMGSGYMFMGTGVTLSAFLLLLIKLLFVVFLTGLVLGVFTEGKKLCESQCSQTKSVPEENGQAIEQCVSCEKILQKEWKLCPYCGGENKNYNSKEVKE